MKKTHPKKATRGSAAIKKPAESESRTLSGHRAPRPSAPIVGIGASAGGLEAFTKLLRHVASDTGLTFVLVQHLDPQHDSALTQLLARATSMPVREITHNLRVKPNQVHVIPPNTTLSLSKDRLMLEPRRQTGRAPRAVDAFFESLAQN